MKEVDTDDLILQDIYNKIMEKPLKIQEIFNDFYGEDKIDLQGFLSYEEFKEKMLPIKEVLGWDIYNVEEDTERNSSIIQEVFQKIINRYSCNLFILVHFPEVRVTNEHDKYVDIKHLWAKVSITYNGRIKGTFTLNRSEYTRTQILSDYLHSHIAGIPTDKSKFLTPCTGTGPINRTITTLSIDFDENIWQLFCLELDKFVRVESLSGVPYRKLENIGAESMSFTVSLSHDSFRTVVYLPEFWIQGKKLQKFLKYIFDNNILTFNWYNGQYGIAMSFTEYIIAISNTFINWYNTNYDTLNINMTLNDLFDANIIFSGSIRDNKIYHNYFNSTSNLLDEGKYVCTFKGEDIKLHITYDNTQNNKDIIINLSVADLILSSVLKIINYSYGKDDNSSRNEEEDSFTFSKTIRFI